MYELFFFANVMNNINKKNKFHLTRKNKNNLVYINRANCNLKSIVSAASNLI